MTTASTFTMPGRTLTRRVLQWLSVPGFAALTDLDLSGLENLPARGPLILAGNHFSFIDPACFVRLASWLPWPLEFLGGAEMPNAPWAARMIARAWGYHPIYRGTGAVESMKAALAILEHGGVLGIFPEGGNWATVLRPARPGAAFIAARSGTPIVPVGLSGGNEVFPELRRGRRARVQMRIGEPFGPFRNEGRWHDEQRAQLACIGDEIMRRIAALLPPERRGHFSDDPAIRAAAEDAAMYPWATRIEGEIDKSRRAS